MTGSGTQQDPYILTTWEELIANRSASSYSVWQGGDLDFNDIAPDGFTSNITIYGSIDFSRATFKNLYLRSGYLYMNYSVGAVENWKLLNCYILLSNSSFYYNKGIVFGSSTSQNIINDVVISAMIVPAYVGRILSTGYGEDKSITFNRCAITLECNAGLSVTLADCYCTFNDCNLKFDMESTADRLTPNVGRDKFNNCKLTGKVLNSDGNAIKLGTSHISSFFDFDEGTYESGSIVVSVYNSEKCTISGTGMEGCTTSELGDAGYLYSIGFPIGVD